MTVLLLQNIRVVATVECAPIAVRRVMIVIAPLGAAVPTILAAIARS